MSHVQTFLKLAQASSLAVSADMHTILIGLCDGNLCVLTGNPKKGKMRQYEVVVQSGNPITNILYYATCIVCI